MLTLCASNLLRLSQFLWLILNVLTFNCVSTVETTFINAINNDNYYDALINTGGGRYLHLGVQNREVSETNWGPETSRRTPEAEAHSVSA